MRSSEGRLSFEAPQRRALAGGRTVERLAAALSDHFIAFDVLRADGQELLTEPYDRGRAVLMALL